jgi:serine/threonine-protein kinase TTK/MPS1
VDDAAEKAAKAAEEKKKSKPRVRENSEMVVVRGVKYLKLECVGQGGTCKVYKVLCPKRKTYALKRIRLQGREKETIAGFMDEIRLLQSLRGKDNIIQLVDAEVCKTEGLIYVVLEYGEIDLARLLSKREKQARAKGNAGAGVQSNAGMIDDNFLRLYFEQMVEAVGTIHEQKIVHSDLKPANFLFVEGALKLIDFGIAKQDTSKSDTTNIVRDHQVGTVNYMSPEAILNGQPSALGGPLKVGRASDIWSLGCILYQMVYGQTPFARITGMIPKLHAITDPKHTIPMPPVANPHLTGLISACLERHPHRRITIAEILSHQFLRPAAAATPASKGGSGGADGEPASPAPSGLSAAQLQGLLEQIQKHGANVDVGAVTQEVFRQIATGESNVSISPLLRKHAKGGNGGEIKTTVSETGDGEMGAAESVAARVGAMDLNAGAGAEAKPDAAR